MLGTHEVHTHEMHCQVCSQVKRKAENDMKFGSRQPAGKNMSFILEAQVKPWTNYALGYNIYTSYR
jgi:hypothetical protein